MPKVRISSFPEYQICLTKDEAVMLLEICMFFAGDQINAYGRDKYWRFADRLSDELIEKEVDA